MSPDRGTAANWTGGFVPPADANIFFDDSPLNNCRLDQDRSVTNITNSQPAFNITLNGRRLTVRGLFYFTNGATIDASATGSTIVFSGLFSAQNISEGNFLNNAAYNLTANNSSGVSVNCDFTVVNSLIINAGKSITITPPNNLLVNGVITNNAGNAGLVIKSDAAGNGKCRVSKIAVF